MVDPYRMVIVNVIASLILFLGIIIYRFIYPKRRIDPLILLILVSFLPLISLLRRGTYESGDLSLHAKLAMSFYGSLREGHIIPRWSSEIFFGFGHPIFLFIYPLPYYLSSLFHSLGFGFINSIKLLLAFSFITSGIFMYLWLRKKIGEIPSFVAAIFYLFSPYHLVDMHFRVAIGEMTSFSLLPLIFLSSEKLIENHRLRWFLLLSLSLSLLILSHQAISLAFFPFAAIYLFFLWAGQKGKNIKSLIYSYTTFLVSIILTAFYWLPMIVGARYTRLIPYPEIEFPNFFQFLYSPWRFGFLFQGPKGELSFLIGYIQWIIVFLSFFLVLKNRRKLLNPGLMRFFLLLFFVVFVLMQSITKPVWEHLFILKNFQFTYRLLLLVSFFTAVLAGLIAQEINKKWFTACICIVVIISTLLNWGNRRTIPSINDDYLRSELPYVIGKEGNLGPAATIWLDNKVYKINKIPKNHLEIIDGKANVTQLGRTSTKHDYLIQTAVNTTFRENALYFPGWTLEVNNKIHPFEYANSRYPGAIVFKLAKGTYKISLIFRDTSIRAISTQISLLSLFFVLISNLVCLQLKKIKL